MKVLRRTYRILFCLLLVGVMGCALRSAMGETVKDLPAKPTDYVSDFAHVLSPEAVAQLDNLCAQLDHSKANAQVAVVTVHDLNGDDAADFADDLETKWGMGKKGSGSGADRGVLVLLAVNVHKYRIEVGYGLEGILNDAKIGDIGREMIPYLRQNDYDSAVLLAVSQLGQVIAQDAGVTLSNQPVMQFQTEPQQQAQQGGGAAKALLFLLVFLFFGGFSLLRFLLWAGLFGSVFRGRPWFGSGGPFIGGGGFGGGGGGGFGGFGGGGFGGGGAGGSW